MGCGCGMAERWAENFPHCNHMRVNKITPTTYKKLHRRVKRGILVLSPQVTDVPTVFRRTIEDHGRVNIAGQKVRCLSPKGCHWMRHSSKLKVEHVRQIRVGKFTVYLVMMVYCEGGQPGQGIISEITKTLIVWFSVYLNQIQ